MARARAAHASACSDWIKGLAQSIANAGYRWLLTAEPALRWAVPLLIIVFLVTVGGGAVIEGYERRRDAIAVGLEDLESVADLIVDRVDTALARGAATVSGKLSSLMPARAAAHERTILLIGPGGTITASEPALSAGTLKDLSQILLDTQLQATVRAPRAGAEVISTDGTPLLVTVRKLPSSAERLVVIEPRAAALTAWHADTMLTVTLLATSGGLLLILGFAFHWQSLRAQEADVIHETVRSRIETALDHGRCGLWDWDLARGVIYWSQSMFDVLGLPSRDELLTLGEVSALIHPEDIKLHEMATQFANDRAGCIDRAFRMRHASGDWLWMRARCELVQQIGEPRAHVIGIIIDITEHKHLAQQSAAAGARLRDAIESVAEMSHELRTPLNAIIGFSEIMESGLFGPLGADKYVEYCRDIRESGSYLLNVISGILDMSRIEAGRAKLEIQDLAVPVPGAAIDAEEGHKISMSCRPHEA